eukprot:3377119-Lingulodinium_polyedra.AAC.1
MVVEQSVDAWFVCEGAELHAALGTGSRPGMSWANALFNYVFCLVIRDVEEGYRHADLAVQLPAASFHCLFDDSVGDGLAAASST